MFIVFVCTHNAQRKVQIEIVGNRVIGHFPGKSNAGTDVAEQRKTIFQTWIFVQSDENLDQIVYVLNIFILQIFSKRRYLIGNLSLNITRWECISRVP